MLPCINIYVCIFLMSIEWSYPEMIIQEADMQKAVFLFACCESWMICCHVYASSSSITYQPLLSTSLSVSQSHLLFLSSFSNPNYISFNIASQPFGTYYYIIKYLSMLHGSLCFLVNYSLSCHSIFLYFSLINLHYMSYINASMRELPFCQSGGN